MKKEEDRERYRQHPIYGTDFSKPTSQLIEDIRNQLVQSRGQLHDIMFGIGWEDRLDNVEGLINCGLTTLYHIKEEIIKFEIQTLDAKFGPSLKFSPRGIGLDLCPCCFICGSERRNPEANHYLHNISAFVASKEEGEKIVHWFSEFYGSGADAHNGARLDFRANEPNWIQLKVGACDKHLPYLEMLYKKTNQYGLIREIDISEVRAAAVKDEMEKAPDVE